MCLQVAAAEVELPLCCCVHLSCMQVLPVLQERFPIQRARMRLKLQVRWRPPQHREPVLSSPCMTTAGLGWQRP